MMGVNALRASVYRTEHLFNLYDALADSNRDAYDRLAGMPQETYSRVEEMLFEGVAISRPRTVLSDVLVSLDVSIESAYHNDFESVLALLNTILDFYMRRLALLRPLGRDEHDSKNEDPELSRVYEVLRDYRDSPEARLATFSISCIRTSRVPVESDGLEASTQQLARNRHQA